MLTLPGVIAASRRMRGSSGGNGSGSGNGSSPGNGSDPFPPPPPEWVPSNVIDIMQPVDEPLEGQMFGPWTLIEASTWGGIVCDNNGCPDYMSPPVVSGIYGRMSLAKMHRVTESNTYYAQAVFRTTCHTRGTAVFYGGFSGGYASLGSGDDVGYRARVLKNSSQPYVGDWAMGTDTSMSDQHTSSGWTFNPGNTLDLRLIVTLEQRTSKAENVFLSCDFFGYTSTLF